MFKQKIDTKLKKALINDNHERIEKLIEEGVSMDSEYDFGLPISLAVKESSLQTIKFILSNGAKIPENSDILFSAIKRKDDNIFYEVLKNGASVHEFDNNKNTPLNISASLGILEYIKVLIKANADLNNQNKNGFTPLHLACKFNNPECAKYLVELGANLNTKNNGGFTPIMYAVETLNYDLTEYLIKKGADLNALNNDMNSIIYIAKIQNGPKLVDLLFSNGATETSEDKISYEIIKFVSTQKAWINHGRIKFHNDFTDPILQKLKKFVAPALYLERPLMFVDFTYSGTSVKSGLLLTNKTLYLSWNSKLKKIKINKIKVIKLEEKFLGDRWELRVNGSIFFEFGVMQSSGSKLFNGTIPFNQIEDLINNIVKLQNKNIPAEGNQPLNTPSENVESKQTTKIPQTVSIEEYEFNYWPAVSILLLSFLALYASYGSDWDYHLTIRGTNISFGWFGLIIAFFMFVNAPKEKKKK